MELTRGKILKGRFHAMAEFGENVRRLRVTKGLTQQGLADQLYVTRQAVSRWEGGSRYPDLMTAKKLAEALDSTMDALLSPEDVSQYARKAPVLESPAAKGAQTAALAFGFSGYLVRLLWFAMGLRDVAGWSGSPVGVVQVLRAALMAALFGYGTLMSIRDRLTPKVAAAIAAAWFGSAALADALSMTPRVGNMAIMLCKALAGGCLVWFFLRDRPARPWPVYAICAGGGVLSLVSAAYRIHMGFGIGGEMGGLLTVNTLVTTSAQLATLCLLGVMARTLYRKRRRAA